MPKSCFFVRISIFLPKSKLQKFRFRFMHRKGVCKKGDNCEFCHLEHDVVVPPRRPTGRERTRRRRQQQQQAATAAR